MGGKHGSKADRRGSRLSRCLHQRIERDRSRDQRSDFASVQLMVKAKSEHAPGLPSDHRRTPQRSAVQYHRCSGRKVCRTLQFRASGRNVQNMHGMTGSAGLQERRHCHRHPRISASVFVRCRVLRVRSGSGHRRSANGERLGRICCQSVNVERLRWRKLTFETWRRPSVSSILRAPNGEDSHAEAVPARDFVNGFCPYGDSIAPATSKSGEPGPR